MDKPVEPKPMITEMSWEDFGASGGLWFANRILEVFGLNIIIEVLEDGTISRVYPARTRYRGFPHDAEEEGFKKISDYMRKNIGALIEEVNDEG